jgi:hypothetical protein
MIVSLPTKNNGHFCVELNFILGNTYVVLAHTAKDLHAFTFVISLRLGMSELVP